MLYWAIVGGRTSGSDSRQAFAEARRRITGTSEVQIDNDHAARGAADLKIRQREGRNPDNAPAEILQTYRPSVELRCDGVYAFPG